MSKTLVILNDKLEVLRSQVSTRTVKNYEGYTIMGVEAMSDKDLAEYLIFRLDTPVPAPGTYFTGPAKFSVDGSADNPSGITVDMTYDVVIIPEAERVKKQQGDMLATLESNLKRARDEIVGYYGDAEREAWPILVLEAVAYHADATAATPMIDAYIAKHTTETKDELKVKVLKKCALYATAIGSLLGEYSEKRTQTLSATTLAQLSSISTMLNVPVIDPDDKF